MKMLEKADQIFPGLKENVEIMETGSPDTFERYTGNAGGALYGFENSSGIYAEARMPIRTHIGNLFQTGHWGRPGGGVWNVCVNGYSAAKIILNSVS
jgi:phytoene dehydrogenase-like protein